MERFPCTLPYLISLHWAHGNTPLASLSQDHYLYRPFILQCSGCLPYGNRLVPTPTSLFERVSRTAPTRGEAVQSFLNSGVDWDTVQRKARWHRVLPLFFRAQSRRSPALSVRLRSANRVGSTDVPKIETWSRAVPRGRSGRPRPDSICRPSLPLGARGMN